MIELIAGSLISIISLLIGFSLGREKAPLPPEIEDKVKEQFQEIFKKKISNQSQPNSGSGVGAVSRPNQEQIDRWNNPKLAEEEQVMQEELDRLNKQ